MTAQQYERVEQTVREIHPRHVDTLAENELFRGIRKEDMPEVLAYLNAHIEEYQKGETIVRLDNEVKPGIILHGQAKISYFDDAMNPMAVDHLFKGHTFGQAAAFLSEYKSQIELVAAAYTIICRVNLRKLLHSHHHHHEPPPMHHHVVASNALQSVSQHAANLHLRLRIIGQKTVRSRLKVYLNHLHGEGRGKIHIPFSMSDLAVYLNSDRSALYKEIRALKEEGVLEWRRRHVHLHRKDF